VKNIRFSLIAPAIRHNLYLKCYESLDKENSVSFEMIFVGNSPPECKMPINFQYIYTNVGPVQCIEIAARSASGEYLISMADDLTFSEGFLNWISFYASKLHMEKVLVGSRYQINGVFQDKSLTFREKCINSPVVPFIPAFKREVWEELGGIDKRFSFAFYDLDMMLRFYEIGYSPFVVPDAWANEIWEKNMKDGLCKRTNWSAAKLLRQFWVEEYQGKWLVVKKRKETVESFGDEDILTINQNNAWN